MRELSARSRRRVIRLLCLAALALAVILLAGGLGRRNAAGARGRSNDQRLAYLQSLGWEADEMPQEEKEVLLPKVFPEVLQNYNELQREAGYDLSEYAGKKLEMYVYQLKNWPSEAEVRCTLYVHRGRIVGGDIHSTAFRGFMQPLRRSDEMNKNG